MNSRRDFLRKFTISAFALPFLPKHSVANFSNLSILSNQGPKLRVAIMGLGGYGTRVAEAMQSSKRAQLVGVISGTPSKIKEWQNKYSIPEKNCYNYENFDLIRDNPDVDAVYIITPNSLHHD